ncbi:MAG: serine/threonine protein kinase, partial [Phycisphaerales bacterium]|nr:serine/threonine protein kinase [Phycisphaerales bacterium]
MNGASRCASIEELDLIALGGLVCEETLAHIDGCGACAQRLEEVRANNDLIGELTAMGREPIADGVRRPEIDAKGYRVIREIHRGGQGVVYLCEHAPTSRRVAVKTLLRGSLATERQRSRFEREVELLAGLRHPGIVTVFDSGISNDGQAYLVMEYLDGRPLDAWLADPEAGRSAPVRDRLRLFVALCDAVNAAHLRGVIHRDLKPENIIVDDAGRPHILDFGVAKAVERTSDIDATRAGDFVGTLVYAAP